MDERLDTGKRRPGRCGRDTIEKIIDTAERLFGRYGIASVSIRQITLEAGVSNQSAVAYHFGDRESLVRAIWQARLPEIEPARTAMLEHVISEGSENDITAIVRVLLLPTYSHVDSEGRHHYAAFLAKVFRWPPFTALREGTIELSPSSGVAQTMLRKALSHIPDNLFLWRLYAASSMFLDLVFERDCNIEAGLPVVPEEVFIAEAINMVVICCTSAPACDWRQIQMPPGRF